MRALLFGWGQLLASTLTFLCVADVVSSRNPIFHPDSTFVEGTSERTIMTPGGMRTYGIHIPTGISGTPALIIDYHSYGNGWKSQIGASGFREVGEARKLHVTVYPQAIGGGIQAAWKAGDTCCGVFLQKDLDDLGFTKAIIEEVKNNMRINPRKIYAYGFSGGSAMAIYVSYKLNDHIAAIAGFGHSLNENFFQDALETKKNDPNFHPIPVRYIHGYNDLLYCWEKKCITNLLDWTHTLATANAKLHWQNWATINDCEGEPVTLAENPPDGDHSHFYWIKAYQNCSGGVEVQQLLNNHDHGGDVSILTFGIHDAPRGWFLQQQYAGENVDFLLRWSLPDYIDVTEPEWWNVTST